MGWRAVVVADSELEELTGEEMEEAEVTEMILYRNIHRTEHSTTLTTDNMRILSSSLIFFFFLD